MNLVRILPFLVLEEGVTTPRSQHPEPRPPEKPVRVDWNPRPSLRLGSVGRIDLRLKLQGHLRSFEPEQDAELDTFHLHRRRAGIQGVLFDRIEFEIERELRPRGPWRDVYVNLDGANWLELKGGKF